MQPTPDAPSEKKYQSLIRRFCKQRIEPGEAEKHLECAVKYPPVPQPGSYRPRDQHQNASQDFYTPAKYRNHCPTPIS